MTNINKCCIVIFYLPKFIFYVIICGWLIPCFNNREFIMIYIYIIAAIVLLGIFWNGGYHTAQKELTKQFEQNWDMHCEECEREIFMAGWNEGTSYVLACQEAERQNIIATANAQLEKVEKSPVKKTAKKVAKKATKKSKK